MFAKKCEGVAWTKKREHVTQNAAEADIYKTSNGDGKVSKAFVISSKTMMRRAVLHNKKTATGLPVTPLPIKNNAFT